MQAYLTKARTLLPVLSRFAVGQLGLQFFNLLNGFFLLRWLTIEQQALFSIAFSVQSLLLSMSDVGFSNSIIALTGSRFEDKSIIGKYVASAWYLRNIFFIIGFLICLALYPLIIKQQNWSSNVFWFNMLPVILAAYWQADTSIYMAPLMIYKKIDELYLPQVLSSALRLLINYVLFLTSRISSFTTLTINALVLFFNSRAFKRKAVNFYTLDDKDPRHLQETRKEMLKYLGPVAPLILFNSFFGQLQVFIIAIFGKTNNIAEVAALGRLSQLFLLISAFYAVLIGPYIAKSDLHALPKKYFSSLALAIVITGLLVLSSLIIPGFYLFILGSKYYHLGGELTLMISSLSINFIAAVFWTMNGARKWYFWWGTLVYIISVTTCQVVALLVMDLSTTHAVLLLSLYTNLTVLSGHLLTMWYGFRKEKLSLKNAGFSK